MKSLLKKIIAKVIELTKQVLYPIIAIGISFAVIMFFIFLGWKGLLGFAVGVLATGFIFMSEHPFVQVYKEMILK